MPWSEQVKETCGYSTGPKERHGIKRASAIKQWLINIYFKASGWALFICRQRLLFCAYSSSPIPDSSIPSILPVLTQFMPEDRVFDRGKRLRQLQ